MSTVEDLTVTIATHHHPWWQWLWVVPYNLYRRRRWYRGWPDRHEPRWFRVLVRLYVSTLRIRVGRADA